MKTFILKALNWYFDRSSKTYAWMPTGTILQIKE